MITDSGLKLALNRIHKTTPDYTPVSLIKLGTNQNSADIGATNLDLPIPITNTVVASCDSTTNWAASTDGSLTQNNTIYKKNSSLNLIKSGTNHTGISYYNQSLASNDFTNKTLYGWIYIKDDTTLNKLESVYIRYGNDYDTNYYSKEYNVGNLTTGWNVLYMSTNDSTEVGSVNLSACDSLNIYLSTILVSDTFIAGDIIIDEFVLATESNLTKGMDLGYPLIDEDKLEVSYEFTIDLNEANGFGISGLGTFNTDANPLMQDIFKFPIISKNSTDEIIFTIKNRLVRR